MKIETHGKLIVETAVGQETQECEWQLEPLDSGLFRLQVIFPAAPQARRLGLRLQGDALAGLRDAQARVLAKQPGILGRVAALDPAQGPLEGSPCLLISHPDQPAFLVGMDRPAEDLFFAETKKGDLLVGLDLSRGLPVALEWSCILGTDPDPFALLEAYGDHLGQQARPVPAPAIGWNSWDYYGGAIAMSNLWDEMRALRATPFADHLKYLVIDMGWEVGWGEWVPNRRFPANPHQIAEEIRAAGFMPGIWLAPLQVHMFSPLARHRQDLLVQAPEGGPYIKDDNALLDPHLPEVLDLLREWFGRLRLAGFSLFKVDFIYRSTVQAIGAGAVRRAFRTIREAIGDEAHLLNCGGPVDCTLGLVDSSRVTTDFHTFWGHIRQNAALLAARYWQNNRLWRIDPDFAVVRSPQTSEDPYQNTIHPHRPLDDDHWNFWLAGPPADHQELRVWLSLVILSGGNIFLSDSMPKLKANGIDSLAKLFPPAPRTARPLDMFEREIPALWLSNRHLGIFNWTDEVASLPLPAGLPAAGRDVWSGRQISLKDTIEVPAHGVYLLAI